MLVIGNNYTIGWLRVHDFSLSSASWPKCLLRNYALLGEESLHRSGICTTPQIIISGPDFGVSRGRGLAEEFLTPPFILNASHQISPSQSHPDISSQNPFPHLEISPRYSPCGFNFTACSPELPCLLCKPVRTVKSPVDGSSP